MLGLKKVIRLVSVLDASGCGIAGTTVDIGAVMVRACHGWTRFVRVWPSIGCAAAI